MTTIAERPDEVQPLSDVATVDIVVPVYNEEAALAPSITRLVAYLATASR